MLSFQLKKIFRKFVVDSNAYSAIYLSAIKRRVCLSLEKPQFARIESTNLCNTHCLMCPRSKLERKTGIMSQDLFAKVVTDCVRLHTDKMLFSGFGEPLMDKEIAFKIRYAKNAGIKEIHLITNASLMDEQFSIALINSGLDLLVVSLDALEKEAYQKIKPGIDYGLVCRNIVSFLELRKKLKGAKPHIKIRLTQPQQTTDEDFCRKIKSLKAQIICSPLHSWSGQWEYSGNVQKQPRLAKRWPCHLLWTSCTILCDGSVSLCCRDFNGIFNFGNIGNKSLGEIWHCDELNRIRNKHLAHLFDDISLCKTCELNQATTMWWRWDKN